MLYFLVKRLLRLELDKLNRHLQEKQCTDFLDPDSLVNLYNIKQEIKRNCKNQVNLFFLIFVGQIEISLDKYNGCNYTFSKRGLRYSRLTLKKMSSVWI